MTDLEQDLMTQQTNDGELSEKREDSESTKMPDEQAPTEDANTPSEATVQAVADDTPDEPSEQAPGEDAANDDANVSPESSGGDHSDSEADPHDDVDETPDPPSVDMGLVNEMRNISEKIDALSEQFKSRIARSEYEEQMLKRYSDEIHEYRSDLFRKITLPLIKEIIGVRDDACSIIARASKAEDGSDIVAVSSVEYLRDALETALDNHGVEVHEPVIGAEVAKGIERPIGRQPTDDPEMHGKIAAVMNDAYIMDGKCIASAKVKVFAYTAPIETPTAAEKAEGGIAGDSKSMGEPGSEAHEERDEATDLPSPAPAYKPEQ